MKTILISGASTGIGEACAVELAKQGWRVFAGVRKPADASHLAKVSKQITPLILDVTNSKQIVKAISTIKKIVGRKGLQGLINNAGIAVSGPLEFLPLKDLRRQLDVNLMGQVELTQACLPLLRLGHGRVINISSIGGRVVAPLLAPYSISKFALEAFSDGLRRELRPWNLPVISVQPGSIDTPIWNKSLVRADEFRARLPRQAETLYGRAMDQARKRAQNSAERGIPAEDVARLVEHILTVRRPRARYAIGEGTRFTLWITRWLPDEWLDWFMARALYR